MQPFALAARVLLTRSGLDARLAAGEDPASDPALTLRSAQLVSAAGRRELARDLERALRHSGRGQSLSAAVPVNQEALAAARPAIEQLIAALRGRAAPRPQGVALAAQLLTEPASPLYTPSEIDATHRAVLAALLTLHWPTSHLPISAR
jgi:hypothetical protein